MLFQSTIPFGIVNEKDMRELIERLISVTGKRVEINHQLVISTDDADVSAMLDSLANAICEEAKPDVVKGKNKDKNTKAKKIKLSGEKNEPTRGPHVRSIKVISTHEMISRYQLNKRLVEKSIASGEKLHSPKYGDIQVETTDDGSLVLKNESGEIV